MQRTITIALAAVALLPSATPLPAQTGSMRVTLPSPTAASLGKFGDVPVNLYTGVPDISIPLFTAQGRTLELPIVLRYHAAGVRVEEIGGWAGLGWALEAGGAITRTVRGLVDEGPGGYYHTGNTFYQSGNWPDPPNAVIDNIRFENVDGEPDQFFFNFAGRSGQFVMGPTTSATNPKEFRLIPYQKLRMVPTFGTGGLIESWEITTEDGTQYTFGAVETNTDYNLSSDASVPQHYGQSYPSSWHLTEIVSPGGDAVTLSYQSYVARHRMASYWERFDYVQEAPGQACVPDLLEVTNEYEVAAQRLASIQTATHTITLTADTLRTDALSPTTGAPQEPRLDRITVATPTGTVLRVFRFEYDYFPGNRLRLTNVYEEDRNANKLPPYSFTYNGATLPGRLIHAVDHWGYYNGKTSNTTPIPMMPGTGQSVLPGADRSPDPAFMDVGMLTRITYPTGGYNEFVWEANDYGAVEGGAMPVAPGPLETETVRSWIEGSTTITVGGTESIIATVFVQQQPGDCNPISVDPPCPFTEITQGGQFVGQWRDASATHQVLLAPGTYTVRASDGGSYPQGWAQIDVEWRESAATYGANKTAGGLRLAELRAADAMGNVTIRKYQYTLQSDPARSSGVIAAEPAYAYEYSSATCSYSSRTSMSRMPLGGGPVVGYREVTVLLGATGEFGSTRHRFRSVIEAPDEPPVYDVWPFSRRTSREWQRGRETGVTMSNASGQVQQRAASAHTVQETPGAPEAVHRFRGMAINSLSAGSLGSTYFYQPFEVVSGWAFQHADTTVTYNESGSASFSTVRTYTYGNPVHAQVTEITETNSDGTERITRMKYPADYGPGSGNPEAAAIAAMQGAAHMHGQVIERWIVEKVGGTERVMQAELTTFREFATGQYLPYQRFVLDSPSPVQ